MERLWVRMAEIFGYSWVNQYGEQPLDTWIKALEHLSPQQIGAGVNAIIRNPTRSKWPPNIPEFLALCMPDGNGVPTMEQAWAECIRASDNPTAFRFSHEVVHVCGRTVGWFDIRQGIPNATALKRRFADEYRQLLEKHAAGRPLAAPVASIEHEGATLTPDQADRAAERVLWSRMEAQGVSCKTPDQLREEMREKLGISRKPVDQEMSRRVEGD
jgi:hypothetical protein